MARNPVLQFNAGKIRHRKLVFQLAIFCIIFFVFASQLSSLEASLDALRQADLSIVAVAFLAVCATFLAAAGAYSALSGFSQSYLSILKVQIASGFANRLLPAGLGGMGLYTFYFRKNGFTLPNATAVVASNNILGILANFLLISTILIINPHYLDQLKLPDAGLGTIGIIGGLLGIVAALLYVIRNHRFVRYMLDSISAVRVSLRINIRTLVAVVCSMSLTSLNVLALSLCVSSVSGTLPWTEALLVLSAGTLLGAVVPTPGGIGGVEAGLLAGMTAFGVPAAMGFASVLLYRSLTYWLPILPGLLAFNQLRKRYA